MGEHAEGVVLAACERLLRVRERRAAFRHEGAVHHDRRALAHAGLFVGDHLHGLLARPVLRADQHGREALQRHPFGAIDHFGRKLFVAQACDPFRELPADDAM